MVDSLDEILSRHEAATTCGCCCGDDFCAYVDKKKALERENSTLIAPKTAVAQRESVRFLNENRPR